MGKKKLQIVSRSKLRIPKKKLLIVTEGHTEAIYFSNFKSSTGPTIEQVPTGMAKDRLVEHAKDVRATLIDENEFFDDDETWVVMDRDINPKNTQDLHCVKRAIEIANNANINLIISNDAFELWYLLHFQDCTAYTDREQLKKMLKPHLGKKYDKTENIFSIIEPFTRDAISRAKKLEKRHIKDQIPIADRNPSCDVYKLVERIIDDSDYRTSK